MNSSLSRIRGKREPSRKKARLPFNNVKIVKFIRKVYGVLLVLYSGIDTTVVYSSITKIFKVIGLFV